MAHKSKTQRAKASAARAAKKARAAEEQANVEAQGAEAEAKAAVKKAEAKPADKKQASAKEAKKATSSKPKKAGFLREVRAELKRVTWPTKQDVLRWSGVVVAALVFFSVFVLVLDNLVVTPILFAISGLGA